MQVGDLVKHIETQLIGVAVRVGGPIAMERWLIHFIDGVTPSSWYGKWDLELL